VSTVLGKSAPRYAELGWVVLPLKGKVPLTPHGVKDATTEPATIRRWWSGWPHANIGLATGRPFFVLDVDPTNGGDETLEALIAKHGPIPGTIQQITGGGGRHYLLVMPDQMEIRNGSLGPRLDIKGIGGYIVAASSVHPDTGRKYTWDGLKPLAKQLILPAPG
jgi:hypothetical protein